MDGILLVSTVRGTLQRVRAHLLGGGHLIVRVRVRVRARVRVRVRVRAHLLGDSHLIVTVVGIRSVDDAPGQG